MDDLKAKITSYKGYLVITVIKGDEDENFVPVGNGRIGCVLMDSSKYLGMSKEAEELAKTMKKSHDAIGDLSSWQADNGKWCVAWIGGFKQLQKVSDCESDRDGIKELHYVEIPNEVPQEASDYIDSLDSSE